MATRRPIVEVTVHNLAVVWDVLLSALHEAAFISIDAEFSGLGDKQGTSAQNMEERYDAMSYIAKSQSIVEFGMSIFKSVGIDSQDVFSVTPRSMTFLVENGFDFNKLFVSGIPFSTRQDGSNTSCSLHNLFACIVKLKPILVLHNGLFDLLFLYHSFMGGLPPLFSDFVRAISDAFPVTYDTKCIAEYHLSTEASYLEYLYHKCERQNATSTSHAKYVYLVDPKLEQYLQRSWHSTGEARGTPNDITICYHYSRHGFCRNGKQCSESHDIHIILDAEEKQQRLSKKRRRSKRDKREREIDNHTGEEASGTPMTTMTTATTTPPRKRGSETEEGVVISKKNKFNGDTDHEALQQSTSSSSASPNPSTPPMPFISPNPSTPFTPPTQVIPRTPATPTSPSLVAAANGCHSAGYDAFMTGYIFASFIVQFKHKHHHHSHHSHPRHTDSFPTSTSSPLPTCSSSPLPTSSPLITSSPLTTTTTTSPTPTAAATTTTLHTTAAAQAHINDVMTASKNRVYLMLKDFPLLLQKSKYE